MWDALQGNKIIGKCMCCAYPVSLEIQYRKSEQHRKEMSSQDIPSS